MVSRFQMLYRYEFLRYASHPRFLEATETGTLHAPDFDAAKRHARSLLRSCIGTVEQGPPPDGIRLFDGRGIELWRFCESTN